MSKSKFSAILTAIIFIPVLLTSCGSDQSDSDFGSGGSQEETPLKNPYPHFRGGEVRGERNFAILMNEYQGGKVEPTPWAGYWWPYTSNGIANGSTGGGSPAGKYDAARGGNTNAQGWEVMNHGPGVRGVQSWWGHCNGWCAAAALFAEPTEPVSVNGVPFGVGDIKALLTEAGMAASADFYGTRVDYGSDYDSPKYTDTVPAQYFLVLTNFIGKLHQAVLIDRYTGDQVWNQPLAGYLMDYPTPADYLGADPAAPNVYRIGVTSTIWWMSDEVPPNIITPPFNFENNQFVSSRTLRMELWLDGPVVFGPDGKIKSSGNVIVTRSGDYFAGGEWQSGNGNESWPDYMWVPYSIVKQDPNDVLDPGDDYVNPNVDVTWLRKHLIEGGVDDPSASPVPIPPVPTPSVRPTSMPTATPSGFPAIPPMPEPSSLPPPPSMPSPRPLPTLRQ
jgi:hypothetical protein